MVITTVNGRLSLMEKRRTAWEERRGIILVVSYFQSCAWPLLNRYWLLKILSNPNQLDPLLVLTIYP
uniref:Uncharacterized protein n=1 Tax=Arundo donax TaxID=35708 RepID=A0A0A9AZS6_ARUDO